MARTGYKPIPYIPIPNNCFWAGGWASLGEFGHGLKNAFFSVLSAQCSRVCLRRSVLRVFLCGGGREEEGREGGEGRKGWTTQGLIAGSCEIDVIM